MSHMSRICITDDDGPTWIEVKPISEGALGAYRDTVIEPMEPVMRNHIASVIMTPGDPDHQRMLDVSACGGSVRIVGIDALGREVTVYGTVAPGRPQEDGSVEWPIIETDESRRYRAPAPVITDGGNETPPIRSADSA